MVAQIFQVQLYSALKNSRNNDNLKKHLRVSEILNYLGVKIEFLENK